jgi:hypothetical protein
MPTHTFPPTQAGGIIDIVVRRVRLIEVQDFQEYPLGGGLPVSLAARL